MRFAVLPEECAALAPLLRETSITVLRSNPSPRTRTHTRNRTDVPQVNNETMARVLENFSAASRGYCAARNRLVVRGKYDQGRCGFVERQGPDRLNLGGGHTWNAVHQIFTLSHAPYLQSRSRY